MPSHTVTPETPTPDHELLGRFVAERDESAFELLVWRHSRLVFEVCRRVLRHRQDAEDAAQAAFLVFARRADTVQTTVGGWLARVAYRCALRLANRRGDSPVNRGCEPAGVVNRGCEPAGDELSADLDAELNRLPDRYRLPLVLCCLQGLSYHEAATQLKVKPGTLSGRLSRAKALLRDRLAARGVVVPAAAVALFLTDLPRGSALSPETVRTIVTAAFAPTGSGVDRVSAVANGVTRMLTLQSFARRSAAAFALAVVLLVGGSFAAGLLADEPKKPAPADPPKAKAKTDKELVQGEWVFDSAEAVGGSNGVGQAWHSVVTFDGDKLTVTKYQGFDWHTTFKLDPEASPKKFDMTVNELAKKVMRFKEGTIKGIYRFAGDDLEICLGESPDAPRPTEFATGPKLKQFRFTLKKKAKDFDPAKLHEFKVKVIDADGKPVEGAVVCQHAMHYSTQQPDEWTYSPAASDRRGEAPPFRTDATGEVLFTTGSPDVPMRANGLLYLRHERRKLVALAPVSPARIMNGLTITLRPEAKLKGKVVFPGGVAAGPTSVYVCSHNVIWVLNFNSDKSEFEFLLPVGEHKLLARGDYLKEEITPGEDSYPTMTHTHTVGLGPEGKEVTLEVKPNRVGELRGKAAPELGEMAEWKGEAVKLADLKGKVVLLYFWDTNLPTAPDDLAKLMELHDGYAAKGLAVVGVHEPGPSKPVTTVKALDERLADARKQKWANRDLPFPVGLLKKQDDPAVKDYGVTSFPTRVLIDKKGNVVGLFDPYREADVARLEKLLAEK
jgi:RNA polymerase sigma factor (sigma-70 family)